MSYMYPALPVLLVKRIWLHCVNWRVTNFFGKMFVVWTAFANFVGGCAVVADGLQ